jgi:diguanylate cyclase (GGDEF)-like protein
MLRTIRSTLTLFNSIAIIAVCAAVLIFSLKVHERLYLEAVKSDLDGLSENMSADMVQLLAAENQDPFSITTTLLRLDRYTHVKFAVVFDGEGDIVQVYAGSLINDDDLRANLEGDLSPYFKLGTSVMDNELVAYKLVGDKQFPLGHLLIVNDVAQPLQTSKNELLSTVVPLTIIIVLLGVLASLWLNSQMLRPFRQLARLASKIKKTNDYSTQIDVRGKSEVRDLTSEFSAMMKTIFATDSKNKAYTEQLKEQGESVKYLANYDVLTKVPNRHHFMEILGDSLNQAKTSNTDPALMYVDLDGFKDVNDTYGHIVGDKLLVKVSERIKALLSDGEQLARLSGDEFLVLINGTPSIEYLEQKALGINHSLAREFKVDDWEINISASLGVASASSAQFEYTHMLSNADIAMYHSKLDGKNTATVFTQSMQEKAHRNTIIIHSITNAIKHDEFHLVYQPKVGKNKQVVGFEALIRWIHPELGFIPPDEFIGIAEKSGKVSEISQWVIEQCCKDLPNLLNKFGKHVVVSLNLSSHDLKIKKLPSEIKSMFARYNISPASVELEVTESAYLENFEEAKQFFEEIHCLGCKIALDDFGTGYSSLSYLTQLDINTLKIDKQFIDKLGIAERDTLIIQTIIQMAKQLNLTICAEGIEEQAQADFLVNEGVQQIQGYFYAKPTKAEELLDDGFSLSNV